MNWLEVTATIFGLLCVWLTVRQNIWCWPTGLVQVLLYIVVFYQVRLYSDALLHVIYVIMQIYGWYHWLHGGHEHGRLHVSQLRPLDAATWVGATIVVTALWGYGMASLTDAALPYGDAFTTVASLVAQWLLTRKKLESWLFWIGVDVAAVGIYFTKGLYPTAVLYTVFLVLAMLGYLTWRRSLHREITHAHTDDDRLDAGEIRAAAPGTSLPD